MTAVSDVENDGVKVITMSEAERASGYYRPQTLEKALEAMYQDGFVVLRGVIGVDFIDKLNEKMCEDAERKIADPTQLYNHGIKCTVMRSPFDFDQPMVLKVDIS